MTLDTTLLDLDRAPTILEMRAFFKKHDWSAAKISEPKSRSHEDHETVSYVQRIMDAAFEKEARKRGMPAWSGYLDHTVMVNGNKFQDNPLIALRDNVEDLVSDGVRMLLTGPDEIVDSILNEFNPDDPELDKKADDFMHTAIGTMLDVMQYDQFADIVHGLSAAEDFNPHLYPNFRAQDHNKKWYHTDSDIKVEYCPDPESKLPPERTIVDPERIAIFNLMVEDYWNTLDDTEKKIHRLTEYGYSQNEVAKKLGYAGNSAVCKRLQKMRVKFRDATGY
ncbi:MAG: hypothetical protein K6F76_03165 [Clostridiales bacterium]|nr:hypothetical protein [Clostridiales bacterium]